MKILHIVEDYSFSSGGLRTVIKNLDFYLKSLGLESYILSSNKEMGDSIFIVKSSNKWLYSKNWTKKINFIVNKNKIDVIHLHGVWLYPQYIGAKYAIKNNVPFILSTHGMYQPWLWKKGKVKKKFYFNLFTKKVFSRASVIHTITSDESDIIKSYFPNNKQRQIPNLISMEGGLKKFETFEKYILYLGRLNRSKGIDLLIKAFSKMNILNCKLKIAGEYNDYKKELQSLSKSLKLNDRIEFLGLVKGEEKTNLIRNAWVMVAPTYSDVIGMVNLEAASLRTPMITTYRTGLMKEWNIHGGRLINPNVEELTNTLIETLNWSLEERNKNGKKLFDFVLKNYSWNSRANDWKNLYKSVVHNE